MKGNGSKGSRCNFPYLKNVELNHTCFSVGDGEIGVEEGSGGGEEEE